MPDTSSLGNDGEPAPSDFSHVHRIRRIFSKKALLNYASEHKQRDEDGCHDPIEDRETPENECE